jgi:phosphoribosylanthranilate isomerase
VLTSSSMRIKICGIRSIADLDVAVTVGADALGFLSGLTHFSEDRLGPDQARDLVRRVPPFVVTVLVTHLTDPAEIDDLRQFVGADRVQLHGEMTVDEVTAARRRMPQTGLIRAVHVTAAVREVMPFAVDVNSGVEDSRGCKSLELCQRFVAEARTACDSSDRASGGA